MAQPAATPMASGPAARRAANPDRRHLHGGQRSAAILEGSTTGAASAGANGLLAASWQAGGARRADAADPYRRHIKRHGLDPPTASADPQGRGLTGPGTSAMIRMGRGDGAARHGGTWRAERKASKRAALKALQARPRYLAWG